MPLHALNHPLVDMNGDIDWDLLGKYLFGECSEEEVEKVQAWINRDPARKALLEELRQVLNRTRSSYSSDRWATDELWDRIRRETQEKDTESASAVASEDRLASERASRPGGARAHTRRQREGQSFIRRRAWAGAILVIAVVGVAALLHGSAFSALWGPRKTGSKTFATQKGQRASVRLTDGTRVRLNVDSRLIVRESFGEKQRAVQLEGEAYFEVARDSTLPFVIRSGGAITQVLGTSFGISAYPEDGETRVVVTEGRVALRADEPLPSGGKQAPRDAVAILTKGQIGQLLRGSEHITQQISDTSYHLAWIEGQLVFQNASFNEVVRKLERWYGLDISPPDKDIKPEGHLNARFDEDRPLDEVLSVVATAYSLKYERREQRVTFGSRASPSSSR